MPRTVSKIESLVKEDSTMESALSAILDTAEDKGVVEWSDVSDDLSSGQWGRLIEKGILVDADGSGFVVDDPEGVREALGKDVSTDDDDDDDSSWTKWDKIALVGSVGLIAGYAFDPVQRRIGGFIDIFLEPVHEVIPFFLIILILAVVTGLISSILQDRLTSMGSMDGYQEKQQELKEREKAAKERGDDEALEEIRKEQMAMMSENLGMMKQQFRSMPWIMLFTIPAFLWMFWQVGGPLDEAAGAVLVMPLIGSVETWNAGVIGPLRAWIAWYIVCSISLSQVIRKTLNVQTSPT